MTEKINSFYPASLPREDKRIPLANLVENLARFKGMEANNVYLYAEGNLVICVNDERRFSIAWENSDIVYSTQKEELFLGPWVEVVESHREEVEAIMAKSDMEKTNGLFEDLYKRPAIAAI